MKCDAVSWDPLAPQSWCYRTDNVTEIHLLPDAPPPAVDVRETVQDDGSYSLDIVIGGAQWTSVVGTQDEIAVYREALGALAAEAGRRREAAAVLEQEGAQAAARHTRLCACWRDRLWAALQIRLDCATEAHDHVGLRDHDPPLILASPHVTTGPPRLHVAALMRHAEVAA
jgi:hypothetical protein